ncbi:MAG TPA: TetR/AcrR family transcriptional regulator [Acidimicrobiales bacterium]
MTGNAAGMACDTRVDPRVDRTRATVLDAVRRLLRSEGPGAVTFGRVSRETGVSRTTLYRHWSSPSDLVADAWSQVVPPNTVAHTPDLRADLVDLFLGVRDVVESATMRRSLPSLLAAAQGDPVIARLHADFVRSRRQPIVDRLEKARRAGDIAPHADPDLLVDLLSGPLFYRQLLRHEPTPDERVAAVVDAVLAVARAR